MNLLIELLNRAGAEAVAFAWPMLWQSSLLIVALYVLDFGLRKRIRPAVRCALWLVLLVKLVLPPSLALPTGVGWWLRTAKPASAAVRKRTALITYDFELVSENPLRRHPAPLVVPAAGLTPVAWLTLAAGAGTVALLGWLIVLWRRVSRDMREAAPAPEWLDTLAHRAGEEVGVRPTFRVRMAEHTMSPAVCGLWRPTVLLPRAIIQQMTPAQLRAVLVHELIHLRRGDVWINCAQTLFQIIYWWHPLLWLANARIRQLREEAVDDAVMLALHEEADTYPATLLEVAKLAFARPLASLGLVGILESRHALRQRVERLVNFTAPRTAGLTGASVVGIAAFTLVAAPMGNAPAPLVHGQITEDLRGERNPNRAAPAATTQLLWSSRPGDRPLFSAVDASGTHPAAMTNPDPKAAPESSIFGISLRKDGSYWHGTNRFELSELRQRLTGEKGGPRVYSVSYDLDSAAPQPAKDALINLCKDLHLTAIFTLSDGDGTPDALMTRVYKVSPVEFMDNIRQRIGKPAGVRYQEVIADPTAAAKAFFNAAGMDGKGQIFFNDKKGLLLVRTTRTQIALMEKIMAGFMYAPAQILIESRFVEVPERAMEHVWKMLGTNNASGNTWTAELPYDRTRVLIEALTAEAGVDILAAPKVVTLSGRRAQVQITDMKSIVMGINPLALNLPGVTALDGTNGARQVKLIAFGPIMDILPRVGADRFSIDLTVTPTIKEFLGYDFVTAPQRTIYVNGKSQTTPDPKPLFSTRQMNVDASVWDSQTLILGGPMDENQKPVEHPGDGKKRLLVFLTPTYIDPAGSPVNGP